MDITTNQSGKQGYATHQLLENCGKNKEIRERLSDLLEGDNYMFGFFHSLFYSP